MVRKLFLGIIVVFFLSYSGCGKEKSTYQELNIRMSNSVKIKLGEEKIFSDKLLVAKKLAKTTTKSGWLNLMGINRKEKMRPVAMPADAFLALVPRADLMVFFEVNNTNDFDVVLGSISFGLSEETVVFFPVKSHTEELWIEVKAKSKTQFEVHMPILKIPSLSAIAWQAIENGSSKWKARGTIVIISKEIETAGLRQRFETGKVEADLVQE